MRIYLVDAPFPPSTDDLAAAQTYGAVQVISQPWPVAYAALGAGGHVLADPTATVPPSITALQAKLELNARGLYASAAAAVAASGGAVQIFWTDAPNWLRTDPNISALGSALGLGAADVDAMFIEAAKL